MSSGQLRNLITIEESTADGGNNGDRANPVWSEFKKAWAGFTFLNGTEDSADRDSTQGKVIIKCRYIPGVTTKMRVVRSGEIYDIEDVFNKDDRKRYLTMICVRSNK